MYIYCIATAILYTHIYSRENIARFFCSLSTFCNLDFNWLRKDTALLSTASLQSRENAAYTRFSVIFLIFVILYKNTLYRLHTYQINRQEIISRNRDLFIQEFCDAYPSARPSISCRAPRKAEFLAIFRLPSRK